MITGLVGIVTRLRAGGSGVRILADARYFFFSPKRADYPWGPTQPHIQWVPGGGVIPEGKATGV
jgi:hypothetical protein